MGQSLFLCIMDVVVARNNYFEQKIDVVGYLDLSLIQKYTVVWMFAYGITANVQDEYYGVAKSTAMELLKCFVLAVREFFEST